MFQCTVCSGTFRFNKNLYQHMRKKHNIEPPVLGGKIACPLLCVDKYRTHKDLRSHLETFHGQVIEKEEQDFPDYEAFETWKKRLELMSGYAYICRISEKTLSKGEAKTHFICHRSGVFRSESTGRRRIKKIGSNKIGTTCPSVMEVSRSLCDGKVHVIFWKTHIGHEADIKRAPVPKKIRPKNSDSINYEVCAVLPAAGIGERMGLDTPKQYIPIHDKPVICYTVEAFLRKRIFKQVEKLSIITSNEEIGLEVFPVLHADILETLGVLRIPFIKKVVVVAASQNLDLMLQTLSQMCTLKDEKLMVTEGSGSRHQSIDSGLKALQSCCEIQPEVVVIHDGVRPFFSEEIVCNLVLAAKEHGAAGVICPLVSTVISIDENGFLDHSLDRNKYKASEMPQAFRLDVICKAYADCSTHDLEHGTECLHLVEKYCDIKAKLLPGSTNLWKITHRKDIYTAKACVKENQPVGIVNTQSSMDLVPFLQTSLCKNFSSKQKWSSFIRSKTNQRSCYLTPDEGSTIFASETMVEVHMIGKMNDTSLNKFPNVIQLWSNKSICDIVDQLLVLYGTHESTELRSIVHIVLDSFDDKLNFYEIQKQAKNISRTLRLSKILFYFILVQKCDSSQTYEEIAELTNSLLFDSNPCISGNIFCISS